ncbi:MAG: hypothetical protein H6824_17850 [Planctomycetaceae bacterium]|nr:hypothetical protein [Planctomycetaceae bacterium]
MFSFDRFRITNECEQLALSQLETHVQFESDDSKRSYLLHEIPKGAFEKEILHFMDTIPDRNDQAKVIGTMVSIFVSVLKETQPLARTILGAKDYLDRLPSQLKTLEGRYVERIDIVDQN